MVTYWVTESVMEMFSPVQYFGESAGVTTKVSSIRTGIWSFQSFQNQTWPYAAELWKDSMFPGLLASNGWTKPTKCFQDRERNHPNAAHCNLWSNVPANMNASVSADSWQEVKRFCQAPSSSWSSVELFGVKLHKAIFQHTKAFVVVVLIWVVLTEFNW